MKANLNIKKNQPKQLSNQQIKKEITVPLEQEEWYQHLIEECRAIVVETEFCARVELIKGKWLIGDRILEEELKFQKAGYGEKIVETVAKDLGINPREIWRCIQFREKYPELCHGATEFDVNQLPGGKNISWRKIVNKYLPEPKSKKEGKCSHTEIEEISFLKCKRCKESLEGYSRTLVKEEMARALQDWAKNNNFPKFNINKEDALPFILSGKKEWERYLQNQFRTIPELWKLWKRIEEKFIQRLQRSGPNLWE